MSYRITKEQLVSGDVRYCLEKQLVTGDWQSAFRSSSLEEVRKAKKEREDKLIIKVEVIE